MEYQICLVLIVPRDRISIGQRNTKIYEKGEDPVNPSFPLAGDRQHQHLSHVVTDFLSSDKEDPSQSPTSVRCSHETGAGQWVVGSRNVCHFGDKAWEGGRKISKHSVCLPRRL